MDAIEELLARDRIRQLAERYAVAVDGKDLDASRRCSSRT